MTIIEALRITTESIKFWVESKFVTQKVASTFVKTINDVAPDENGNIDVETSAYEFITVEDIDDICGSTI